MESKITSTQIQHLEAETILSEFAIIKTALQGLVQTVKPSAPVDEYLTRDEVATLLKVSKVTVWLWSKPTAGILSPRHIGNKVRYLKSEVVAVVEGKGKGL